MMTLAAAVAQILGLGVSLRAIAENGDGLAFEDGEIGVVVVVDFGRHLARDRGLGVGD